MPSRLLAPTKRSLVTYATTDDPDGHLCATDCTKTKHACLSGKYYVPYGIAGVCTPREDQTHPESLFFADGFCGTGFPYHESLHGYSDSEQVLGVTVGINLSSSGLRLGSNTDFVHGVDDRKWYFDAVANEITSGVFGFRYNRWYNPGYGAEGQCAWTVPFDAEHTSDFFSTFVAADKADLLRNGGNALCVCVPGSPDCDTCNTINNTAIPPVKHVQTQNTSATAAQPENTVQYYTDASFTEALGDAQNFIPGQCSRIVGPNGIVSWRMYTCSGTFGVKYKLLYEDSCKNGDENNDLFDGTGAVMTAALNPANNQYYFVKCPENYVPVEPTHASSTTFSASTQQSSSNDDGLVIGLSVGGAALFLAVVVYAVWGKRQGKTGAYLLLLCVY